MAFDYDECRSVLRHALIMVLQEHRERIRSLHESHEIWAVAYEIIPWQPFAALSIRVRDETDGRRRYDLADWKHYFFATNRDTPALKEVADYCTRAFNDPEIEDDLGVKSGEVTHLLYLAAAEAILDSEVAAFLNSLGVRVAASDVLRQSYFEFVVLDSDGVLKCNYCEIVRANRVTKRLLGRTV